MNFSAKTYAIMAALAVFVGLPLLLYTLGDAPRRSLLKESVSILTLMALTMMLGQFFLARSNETLLRLFKPPSIQKFHKVIAYSAVGVILLHPVLVVLPRSFEAGVKPWDAFFTMLTSVDNLGIVLGLVAWLLLLVLATTAYFRKRLIPRFPHHYLGWRYFHGGLAVTFTVLALWHSIALGRHTDIAMSVFFVTVALIGFALLARLYWRTQSKKPVNTEPPTKSVSAGAST